jgi:hypothetical protein
MATVRHRTFVGPTIYSAGGSLNENREVIRAQAQAFVNTVGGENVVSVCEHAMTFGPFSVVVWYRGAEGAVDEEPVVQVSNATIARALQAARARSAPPPALTGWATASLWAWMVLWMVLLATVVALLVYLAVD